MTARRPRFPLPLQSAAKPAPLLRPQRPLQQAADDAVRRAVPAGLGLDSDAVRQRMVQRLRAEGIADEAVLMAFASVLRHRFVDSALATQAYEDTSLPIGHGQTISKPSVVARMLQLLFGGMFLGGPGDAVLIATLSFFGGTANGCGAVISQSIKADVIDYDEWRTGERKEGAYFAAWSFVFKGSGGITMMITGIVLQLAGFEPNVEQSDAAKLAMRILFAIFPLVCYAAGAVMMTRFALNREEHAKVRAQIDARRARDPGAA